MTTEAIETPFGMGTLISTRMRDGKGRQRKIFHIHIDLEGSQGLTQHARVLTLVVQPSGGVDVKMPQGITKGLAVLNWVYQQASWDDSEVLKLHA